MTLWLQLNSCSVWAQRDEGLLNRINRLTAILLHLQTGKRSAAEIVQHCEVSRRTFQHNIDALHKIDTHKYFYFYS